MFVNTMVLPPRWTRIALASCLTCLALVSYASTALATFPGANGRIAYIAQDSSVHTVLPSGHGDRTISPTGFDPTWSPNGKRLAFTAYADYTGGGSGGTDVYTMRADGTDVRQLTEWGDYQMGFARNPSYSPGGGRIVFTSGAYHYEETITIMRSDGSDGLDGSGWQYPLPYREGADPVWSPGGEIAYWKGGERRSIWAVNPDGSGAHRLVYDGKAGDYGGDGPIYSPDDSEFMFVHYRADRRVATRVAKADGSDVRPAPCPALSAATLGTGTAGLFPIAYSPDGRWLLVYRYSGSSRRVDLLRLSLASCNREVIVRGVTGEADWQSLLGG